jgi:diguanylate cyclase
MLGGKQPTPKSDSTTEAPSAKAVRAGATFRLTVSFMLVVVVAFLAVEDWRTWRDYRSAFASARDSVTAEAVLAGRVGLLKVAKREPL